MSINLVSEYPVETHNLIASKPWHLVGAPCINKASAALGPYR